MAEINENGTEISLTITAALLMINPSFSNGTNVHLIEISAYATHTFDKQSYFL